MIRLFFIGLLLFSSAAYGQEIQVRSGDHGSFTRLVFDVPSDEPWKMTQQGARISLLFPNHKNGFATSAIYDRIDRNRIASVSGTESELSLQLACECTVTAFSSGRDMVVVDVAGPTNAGAKTELPPLSAVYSRHDPHPPTLGFGATLTAKVLSVPSEVEARPSPERRVSDPTENGVTLPFITPEPASSFSPLPAPIDFGNSYDHETLEAAQDQLSREIAEAATKGVLKPNGRRVKLPGMERQPQIDTSAFDDHALPSVDGPVTGPQESMRITTSMDFQANALPAELATTPYGPGCIDPASVSVEAWADDRPMPAQLAEARAPLFGEFDALNTKAALRLSRLYLHYGFGPEAMRILDLDPELRRTNNILVELGEIMEFGHVRAPQVLKTYVECDSALALWAILSLPKVPTSTVINSRAALRSLNTLPPHLRNFIAPELSQRLLAYGDKSGAATALRSVERLPGHLSDDTKMAQADLDLAKEQFDAAQGKLTEVIDSNSAQSALALIKSIASQIAQNQPISQETTLLVEAYALEFREDALGPELRKMLVLSLARSGQFEASIAAIDALPPNQQRIERATLTNHVIAEVTEAGEDMTFLDLVYGLQDRQALAVSDDTRIAVADRLVSLGFASEANTIMAQLQQTTPTAAVLLLKARIALDMQQPGLAQAYLLDLKGDEADRLMARALKSEGKLSEASALFRASGDDEAARTAAFLAQDWQNQVAEDAPLVGPLARLTNTPLAADPAREGMLARSADALSESAAARSYIGSLLNDPVDGDTSPQS
ncbi:hypothetical protein [Pseudosulfitobacter sp. DSM 107133]|uniref:hypothetical protein n=1 Tax=Pseudosulfitobacter sp. DSM 107133 TaxID=2883100 RepID=UPI000DF3E181|nr:hypothetical protein [Pseudosulfitobacter sp. DSM 107133]UOA28811.1 hypothetical protein DSM107133_03569 [Pseudosulfitobacter sp. DSM 107133]